MDFSFFSIFHFKAFLHKLKGQKYRRTLFKAKSYDIQVYYYPFYARPELSEAVSLEDLWEASPAGEEVLTAGQGGATINQPSALVRLHR